MNGLLQWLTNRSSRPEVFCKKETMAQVFSCEFCEISKTTLKNTFGSCFYTNDSADFNLSLCDDICYACMSLYSFTATRALLRCSTRDGFISYESRHIETSNNKIFSAGLQHSFLLFSSFKGWKQSFADVLQNRCS